MEERCARAEGWLRQVAGGIGQIEPEWWLRMQCGQVAEEALVSRSQRIDWFLPAQLRRLAQILGRRGTSEVATWTLWLPRRDLPGEPPWWVSVRA